MKNLLIPPDEGLKKPVRKFEDTFSGEDLILSHFFPEKYAEAKRKREAL